MVTSFKKFRLPPVQTKLSLPSDDASSGVCETMAPPDNLKDLFFAFNNLSSCNLSSMVEQPSESVGDIYLPWVAVYLVEQAYIEPNLHTLYLHFWTIWLIDLLTLEESYRRIGLAFTADLSFNLSFDRAILKNLSHWLGLQTCEGCPCLC